MRLGLIALAIVALASCSTEPEGVPATVKQRVSVFAEDRNCQGLQAEFDAASDAEVMRYIDGVMRDAECY